MSARALCDKAQRDAHRSVEQYHAVPEPVRRTAGLVLPTVPSDEEILQQAFDIGIKTLLNRRAPNSVIALNVLPPRVIVPPGMPQQVPMPMPSTTRRYKAGEVVTATVHLPIGCEILEMVASKDDGPNWDVFNLIFGTMNVCNPQRTGPIPLSDLLHMTVDDLLSPFKDKQTKAELAVTVNMICKTDDATFDGYRIFIWQEEQLCATQTRLEPAARFTTFPCQQVPFRHIFSLAPDTSLATLRAVLDGVREAIKRPRVWPNALVNLTSVEPPFIVDVGAVFQAATAAEATMTREGLLLAVLEVVERTGAKITPRSATTLLPMALTGWRG